MGYGDERTGSNSARRQFRARLLPFLGVEIR